MPVEPSSTPRLSPEDFRKAIQAERDRALAEPVLPEFSVLGTDAAVRMALVPGWTSANWTSLGVRLDPQKLSEAVVDLEKSGLLESTEPGLIESTVSTRTTLSATTVFHLTFPARVGVLAPQLRDPSRARAMQAVLQKLGEQMLAQKSPLLESVRRWCELATFATDGGACASAFDERINTTDDTGEVSMWIDAAKPIALVLERAADSRLTLAIERAGRRLELLHRLARDEGRLKYFIRREEQIQAIRQLVNGPDDRWALHLIGVGGVGKTMLLRYLSVNLAKDFGAAVARVDFDYLTSDYPSYAPGELLWNFEEELRLRDRGGAERRFEVANRYLKRLHDELSTASGTRTTAEALASPLLKSAITEYIGALRSLPRVILVLDTCEELLRVRPGRDAGENIDATFKILGALHGGPQTLDGEPPSETAGLPKLRVILAGRRPLASGGPDWHATSNLPSREFLRLLPLRGFTRRESTDYLRGKRRVSDQFIEPILGRVPSDSELTGIETSGAAERRYNPYDLGVFADWATEEPPPSVETISTATPSQYIERRVLGRLRNAALERLMPVLATVKHVDESLLRHLSPQLDDATFAGMTERLRQQEWSSDRLVARGDRSRVVYSVDEKIRARLWTYYRGRPDQGLIEQAAEFAEDQTLSMDLGFLDWTDVDAALRALDFDPARAARWWLKFEERILSQRDIATFDRLLDKLFSEGNVAGPIVDAPDDERQPDISIRPLLLASLAPVTLHTESVAAAADVWAEVEQGVASLPVPPEKIEEVKTRARLGLAAAYQSSPDEPSLWSLLEQWNGKIRGPLIGSFIAATEAAVERADTDPSQAQEILRTASGQLGPVLLAGEVDDPFVYALAGRACALTGNLQEGEAWFEKAITRVNERRKSSSLSAINALDWVAPADIGARIRLEALRSLYPEWMGPAAAIEFSPARESRIENADQERHASMVKQLGLASTAPWLAGTVVASPPITAGRQMCRAHSTVPPLYVSQAEELIASGRVDAGLTILHGMLARADEILPDDLAATQRASLRVGCRMRLAKEMPSSLAAIRTAEDYGLVWMLSALVSPSPAAALPQYAIGDPEWIHQRLRSSAPAAHRDQHAQLQDAVTNLRASLLARDTVLSLVLDLREAQLLSPKDSALGSRLGAISWPGRQHGLSELARARIALRASAVYGDDSTVGREFAQQMRQTVIELTESLGMRRLAVVALEEGDALALRLPVQATALLQRAHDYFQGCDDPMGSFLAAARIALIAAVLRDHDRLASATALARNAWETLRGRAADPTMVSWDELATFAHTLGPQDQLPGRDAAWRPWLARVVTILALARRLDSAGPTADVFERWMSNEFGSPLPVDLQGVLESSPPDHAVESSSVHATEIADAPSLSPSSLSSDFSTIVDLVKFEFRQLTDRFVPADRQDLLPLFFVGFTILTAVAALWGLGYALTWLADVLRSVGGTIVWAGPLALVLVIGMFVIAVTLSLLVRTRARITVEPIAVSDESEQSRAVVTAQITMQIPRPNVWPKGPQVISGTCTTGGVRDYRQSSLSTELQTAMNSLSRHAEVKLELPNGSAAPCWEGALTHSLEAPGPNVRRSSAAFVQRTQAGGRFELHVAAFGADGTASSMIRDGWGALSRSDARRVVITSGAPSKALDVTVVHLVGTVEESASGAVFELAGSRTPLRAQDVLESFPRAQLCILQGSPLKRFEIRRDGTRRDANVVRWFAHDVHGRGVPVVVVIPPLETRVGAAALSEIASCMRSTESLTVRRLMRATRRIRMRISNVLDLATSDRSELASDVCVYCPDDWRLVQDSSTLQV